MKEKLPLSKQVSYSLGQFGWSLLVGIINTYLVFFYIPTKESGIGVSVKVLVPLTISKIALKYPSKAIY